MGTWMRRGVCVRPLGGASPSELRIRPLAPVEAPDVPISCLGAFPVTVALVEAELNKTLTVVESCVCALAERWTSSPQTAARQSARPSRNPALLCD